MEKFNIYKIVFVFCLFSLILVGFLKHPIIETNILKAILPDNEKSSVIFYLANKSSAKINFTVEASSKDQLLKTTFAIKDEIKNMDMPFVRPNFKEIFELYKNYPINFLSRSLRKELSKNNLDKFVIEKKISLYDPLYSSVTILPLAQDPFMLLTDYFANLSNENNYLFFDKDDKFYSVFSYYFDKNLSLSPANLNKQIEKLIRLQDKYNTNEIKIYISGAPVHAYFASKTSARDINFVSLVSVCFVFSLIFYYFKSFKPIVAVSLSILFAILAGYAMSAIFFSSIHILTFVFSTSLIGICIDYSLHFFVEYKENVSPTKIIHKISKSLTVSLFTTICAFGILFFSKISLLQQIAVFTITGLVSVYLIVILFYPVFFKGAVNLNEVTKFNFSISKNFSILIFALAAFIMLIGFPMFKINNDITLMYKPNEKLLVAENLYNVLMQKDTKFLLVKSSRQENFQKHIELEESIIDSILELYPDAKIEAFSKYVPSVKRQTENVELISNLYKKKLFEYADFLDISQKKLLLENIKNVSFFVYKPEEYKFLNDFFVKKNTSLVILENVPDISIVTNNPNIISINLKKDLSGIISECSQKCLRLILPAFLVMLLGLTFVFNIKNALILVLPSCIASCLTLIIPTFFHQQINFFHLLSVFLIIGFGIDYSIFRFNGSRNAGDAVFLSAVTTIFSFSLLAFTEFKLVSSIGFALAVGLFFSYLFSFIVIRKNQNDKLV